MRHLLLAGLAGIIGACAQAEPAPADTPAGTTAKAPPVVAFEVAAEPGVAQAVDDQVHAQREHHDLPGRALQHLARADDMAPAGHRQQQTQPGPRPGAAGCAAGERRIWDN